MKKSSVSLFLLLPGMVIATSGLLLNHPLKAQTPALASQSNPSEIQIPGASIPTRVLLQSPAETAAELQIICLFESSPQNMLHASLLEMNNKLQGLLEQLRKPTLFRGDLGETILLQPAPGTLGARKLLIIGLGDAQTFMPQRMEFVGAIAYRESTRLGIAHPFFAPTILDGGVTNFTTGQVAERFVAGFLRGMRTEKILSSASNAQRLVIQDLTYLAGPAHAADTKQGIEKAFASN